MGRRKIEIQPITHERNRSVTFLKRRNGLFKKAYELGVLCSVDIAVIIFEERPGHSHKLFQYGSSNVQEIIQRRLRYDGEMDSRGPSDFSGTAVGADIDEADEEEVDEDPDDLLSSSMGGNVQKRKIKSDRVGANADYQQPSHLGISIPLQHQVSSSSSIPTSSDRFHSAHDSHHSHQSKKPRIGGASGHPQTPHSPYSGGGHVSPRSTLERPSGGSSYRDLPSVSSHQQSYGARPSSSSSYQQYPFFQSSQGHHSHSPPTPSFIPLQPEFSLSSTSRTRGRSSSGTAPYVPRTSGYETNYTSRQSASSGNGDIFANLDSGRGRSGGNFTLDWPVHSQPPPPPPPGSAPPRIIASAQAGDGPSGQSGGGATDISRTNSGGADSNSTADWLDFLSGAGNGANPPGSSTSSKNPVPSHIVGGRPPSSGGHAG